MKLIVSESIPYLVIPPVVSCFFFIAFFKSSSNIVYPFPMSNLKCASLPPVPVKPYFFAIVCAFLFSNGSAFELNVSMQHFFTLIMSPLNLPISLYGCAIEVIAPCCLALSITWKNSLSLISSVW